MQCLGLMLRVYTARFGKALMEVYEKWRQLPLCERAECRGRADVNLGCTDREIFASLPLGDLWIDSRIHEVFLYLYHCKNVEPLECKGPRVWVYKT